jgi:hypothetical protein
LSCFRIVSVRLLYLMGMISGSKRGSLPLANCKILDVPQDMLYRGPDDVRITRKCSLACRVSVRNPQASPCGFSLSVFFFSFRFNRNEMQMHPVEYLLFLVSFDQPRTSRKKMKVFSSHPSLPAPTAGRFANCIFIADIRSFSLLLWKFSHGQERANDC